MSNTPHALPPRRIDGLAAAIGLPLAFVSMAFLWLLVSAVLMVGLMVGEAAAIGVPFDENNPMPTAFAAGAGTFIQLGGWAAAAVLLGLASGATLREVLAARWAPLPFLAIALVSGLFVGLFPGLIADFLRATLPAWMQLDSLGQISNGLTEGPMYSRIAMLSAVVIAAPLFEEIVFRGFLWDALSRAFPMPVVLVATSAMFAAFHMDPVQASAVLFTGLFLGWLRYTSDSLVPCIIVHAANNGLATVVAFTVTVEADEATPVWVGLLGLVVTLAFTAVAFALRVPANPGGDALIEES